MCAPVADNPFWQVEIKHIARFFTDFSEPSRSYLQLTNVSAVKSERLGLICALVAVVFPHVGAVSATAHLALADQARKGPKDKAVRLISHPVLSGSLQCLKLAELHSQAVDFPKTGRAVDVHPELLPKMFPDFAQRPRAPTYQSHRALGKLFRKASSL